MKGIVTPWNFAHCDSTPPETPVPMQTLIANFPLANASDVKAAIQRAKLLGNLVDLSTARRNAFGRAVEEIGRNSVQHCGGGHVSYQIDSAATPPKIDVVVADKLIGSEAIQAILGNPEGPDCGLRRASKAVDQLVLEQVDENTKQIRIAMAISEQTAEVDESDIADWAGVLRTCRVQNVVAATQRRSRKLAKQLAGIQRQRQDLSAELEQSRSMNETLTLLSLVASKTDNAVVIMDAGGVITWINDAFIRMTGYAIQDASGARPDKLLCGPNTSRESIRELEQAFQHGHGINAEFLQYHRQGTTKWISLSLTPIHNESGNVTRWIGIGADINKRKEAERELQNARAAAENASQLKGQFLANISHEIRTPMNAIIGMTDLTLSTQLGIDQREYLTTVKQSAESLLELLNDVLDLSKIEAGRLQISESVFDLRDSIDSTLRALTFVAEQKGLTLNVDVGDDVPSAVVSDSLRLRQILINLVGNAIKFTADGHVKVTVQKQWQADQEVRLEFIVADTGMGIAASKLDRIFEAFGQADSSVTREFGGTGLGLTITSHLLHLMNGRIWVQSEVGKGSRFHFTLPCRRPTSAETQEFNRHLDSSAAATLLNPLAQGQSGLKILVADDHPANRKLLEKILQKRGHTICLAKNGIEVLNRMANDNFSMILMDVQMPEMDGYQATVAIRERERDTHSHIPIIAVTAHAMQGQREKCLAAGMDAYMSKPVKTLELLTLIDSLRDNEVNVSATSATSTGYVAFQGSAQDPDLRVATESSGTADAQGAASTIGFANALERLDNDEELLREQMQFFLKDGPKLVTMIKTAIVGNNGPDARIAAHRLKNLCATFDDNETAALCGRLEADSAAGNISSASELSLKISQQVERLLTTIRRYCGD